MGVDELVEVRWSPRARRWRLAVPWGEPARLTVPRSMSREQIEAVIDAHRGWVAGKRARQVPRLGLDRRTVSEAEGRRAARELVTEIAETEAAALDLSYRRIQIRDQRSRWG